MTRLPATEARIRFAELVNDVAFGGERVVLQRHGKDIAAVVPIEDLALLEELEDRIDLDAARKALRDKEPAIAWGALKRELGLKR
ncbi:MAG TPA: type II toxin-antitoxin system Phd/YefM family antitoxin [Gemmatimonadaceae bacterium]|nr:type II toxin-antitoxin system Phd/YefM family antitoxin [Gemmatimonadaceae bacterium]